MCDGERLGGVDGFRKRKGRWLWWRSCQGVWGTIARKMKKETAIAGTFVEIYVYNEQVVGVRMLSGSPLFRSVKQGIKRAYA